MIAHGWFSNSIQWRFVSKPKYCDVYHQDQKSVLIPKEIAFCDNVSQKRISVNCPSLVHQYAMHIILFFFFHCRK